MEQPTEELGVHEAMLGHEDASTTLRHYAGLLPTELDQLAKRRDQYARTARHKAQMMRRDTVGDQTWTKQGLEGSSPA